MFQIGVPDRTISGLFYVEVRERNLPAVRRTDLRGVWRTVGTTQPVFPGSNMVFHRESGAMDRLLHSGKHVRKQIHHERWHRPRCYSEKDKKKEEGRSEPMPSGKSTWHLHRLKGTVPWEIRLYFPKKQIPHTEGMGIRDHFLYRIDDSWKRDAKTEDLFSGNLRFQEKNHQFSDRLRRNRRNFWKNQAVFFHMFYNVSDQIQKKDAKMISGDIQSEENR